MSYDAWATWAKSKIGKAKKTGGALTAGLLGKTAQKKFKASEPQLEEWLTKLRDEGAVAIANGRWYER